MKKAVVLSLLVIISLAANAQNYGQNGNGRYSQRSQNQGYGNQGYTNYPSVNQGYTYPQQPFYYSGSYNVSVGMGGQYQNQNYYQQPVINTNYSGCVSNNPYGYSATSYYPQQCGYTQRVIIAPPPPVIIVHRTHYRRY